MKNIFRSILILLFLFAFQLGNHFIFIEPQINHWGASKAEATAAMPNDDKADFIVSTRAITIDKPVADVWLWINQLGADRSGFFSYYFIEHLMGYYTRELAIIKPDFPEFKIGDIVRGSTDPKASMILYEFKITDMKSNDYFTADTWGTFQVKIINANQTRLIIRTHGIDRGGFAANTLNYVAHTLHFIMERATINGFKKRIEAGQGPVFSALSDMLWFVFIIISGLLIGVYIFILKGINAIILPFIFSSLWMVVLFLAPPTPLYSGALAVTFLLLLGFKPKWLNTQKSS